MADTLKRGIKLRNDGDIIEGLQEDFDYISDSSDEPNKHLSGYNEKPASQTLESTTLSRARGQSESGDQKLLGKGSAYKQSETDEVDIFFQNKRGVTKK